VHLNPSVVPFALVRDALFLAIAKLFRKRVLVFFHGWNTKDEVLLRLLWCIYQRADGFVVLAREFDRTLRALGYRGAIYRESTVFDDTVVGSVFRPAFRDGNTFTVLFLARVVKEKGIYEALQAYTIAKQEGARIRLVVAGDGSELEAARRYVKEHSLSDVTFTGHISGDVKTSAFESADCYFLPTYHSEGLPGSMVEAMAHGLPVITRPVGGIKDFFEHDKMGLLEGTLEPDRFAGHILRLATDPALRSAMSAYNREYAFTHFAASVAAVRLHSIYAEVLAR
jgi:glycosyltransferase involved in cell wall biosynthesis